MKQTIKKELVLLKDLGMMYATETSKQKFRYGIYECFCGNIFESQTYNVNKGNVKSCGCSKGNRKHNLRNHRLYGTWKSMIYRCTNQGIATYKYYGGRGITVCDEWLDVRNFIEDMYPTFKEGLSLDRIDSDGNYEPSNCRWANANIQNRNKRLLQSNNKSGYRGVSWHKASNKWIARIIKNGKCINIGSFIDKIDGAKAYDNYIISNNLEHTKNFNNNDI